MPDQEGDLQHQGSSATTAEERYLIQSAFDEPHMRDTVSHPKATERLVIGFFVAGILAIGAFAWSYWYSMGTQLEGGTFALACALIAIGITSWGKYLMPQGPFVEDRKPMASSPHDRAVFEGSLDRGVQVVRRRSVLGVLFGLGSALLAGVLGFPLLRSLGPQPKKLLYTTAWKKGSLVVQADGTPVKATDMDVGGLMTVFPQGDAGGAISQTLLIRVARGNTLPPLKPGREGWTPDGYVAFSKVCTHAGCPVSLYMEQTEQLLCPCHQSLFDILSGAMPVFGPAPRPLPQLPLYVDSEGYLRSQAGYDEPIGPGFWERM